jgi:hypothetical protein
VELYPKRQTFRREPQKRQSFSGVQNDLFLTRESGESYLKDLPNAEVHRLNSGHFAIEDCSGTIATNIVSFYERKVGTTLKPPKQEPGLGLAQL